ncbi:hypothetical protein [Rubritalea tangerina]
MECISLLVLWGREKLASRGSFRERLFGVGEGCRLKQASAIRES